MCVCLPRVRFADPPRHSPPVLRPPHGHLVDRLAQRVRRLGEPGTHHHHRRTRVRRRSGFAGAAVHGVVVGGGLRGVGRRLDEGLQSTHTRYTREL